VKEFGQATCECFARMSSGETDVDRMSDHGLGYDAILAQPEAIEPGMVARLSSGALAYLGDSVFELWMRRQLLLPPKRPDAYHRLVVANVRAERQAQYLDDLQPHLTEAEADLVRRARNATPKSKRADPAIYQKATGLEALIGYLYLMDRDRLNDLLGRLDLQLC
jgi:ribonuclease III family protein